MSKFLLALIIAASPLPTPLVLPPRAVPQILAVTVNDPVFHSGETILANVITSTNVAAVEFRILGRAIRFRRTGFGVWHLNYKVPRIPWFMRHAYDAKIVAFNAFAVTAERAVRVSLR